jgi:chromate reductase, NAD(P)H dehydrogenase (quinone)
MMNILAISGSLRKESYNSALIRALQSLAPDSMKIDIADLRGISVYDGDEEDKSGKPPTVTALDARIRAADAVIISTPEYNFSLPGGLKNALDWLSRQGSPLRWKPVGVMGASTGPVGTARAQYHLRQTLQHHEALVMPKPEVFVRNADKAFSSTGELTDAETRKFVTGWLAAFAAWVERRP